MRLPLVAVLLSSACNHEPSPGASRDASAVEYERADEREAMVREQIWARGVGEPRVLAAMQAVPRHRFVPDDLGELAYADRPLPIGHGVTISQPYIVAWMSELADVAPGERVLEIGTGSGYQAAVLAQLGAEVYSIERIAALADQARARLGALGYTVEVRHGDGWLGWPEHAPFAAILLTAAPSELPQTLLDQLAVGGRLVAPVGADGGLQRMIVVERSESGLTRREYGDVAFVPMLPGTTPE
jgi:protein-L-isoaspartate(D-aspartate) O-methyltransferase